jgi:hypothetical protein
MAIRDRDTLKSWFRTGLYPTQEQFWDWIDSYYNKLEGIDLDDLPGLTDYLNERNDALLNTINEIVTEAMEKIALERKIQLTLYAGAPLTMFIGEQLTLYHIASDNVAALSINGSAVELDTDIAYDVPAGSKITFVIQTELTDAEGYLYVFARAANQVVSSE